MAKRQYILRLQPSRKNSVQPTVLSKTEFGQRTTAPPPPLQQNPHRPLAIFKQTDPNNMMNSANSGLDVYLGLQMFSFSLSLVQVQVSLGSNRNSMSLLYNFLHI